MTVGAARQPEHKANRDCQHDGDGGQPEHWLDMGRRARVGRPAEPEGRQRRNGEAGKAGCKFWNYIKIFRRIGVG